MNNFIFDLDGTLLNTLEDIARACNFALMKNALGSHNLDDYRKMVGNGFDKLVLRALPPENLFTEVEICKITAEAKSYYTNHLYEHTFPYPQISQVLQELQKAKKAIAVLSNKPDPMTKEIIHHFFPEINFTFVQGGTKDKPLKPSPEVLLELMKKHSWQKDESCFVGDSDVDIQTGKNANIYSIAVTWGFRDKDELENAQPNFICSSPKELLSFI